ncbi:MAG: TRAP transporter large permease [Paracoccus denitrificans]|nr:MAG: TRAP transporter large permease [Paracoccus denitrificans]PZO84278.1 MAG: TRAP transporter large permease [Paracoccus denitrificans]
MILTIVFLLLAVFLVFGLPVAFAMGIAGAVGLWMLGGWGVLSGILSTGPLSAANSYEIITIPMFVLMAEFVIMSGVARGLFKAATIWVGRLRGGVAMATALAGAGFAAISGSSTAAAATLASTSLPAMMEEGYEPSLAGGVVAISGTLAMLIPPSIALVLFGIIADIPVGGLLIGGIIPGLIVTLAIILTVAVLVRIHPEHAPMGQRYTMRQKLVALKGVGPMLLLFVAVSGMIYSGVATPTEAAGIGAFVAMLLALYERKLTFQTLRKALISTAHTTAMILLIILCAQIFGYYLTLSRVTFELTQWVGNLPIPPLAIIALILLGYLILGFFMDQIAILILTVPVVLPIVMQLGYDPIWFGVLVVVTAEVGMVTPPMGMNVFVVARYTGRPLNELFRGVTPHVIAHLLVIALLVMVPGLILWLPNSMN